MSNAPKRIYLICRACDREHILDRRLREIIARKEQKGVDEVDLEDLVPYLENFKCNECGANGIKVRTEARASREIYFVASQNKGVFHRSDCSWIKHVNMENWMSFKTRDAAMALGLEPCKVCTP